MDGTCAATAPVRPLLIRTTGGSVLRGIIAVQDVGPFCRKGLPPKADRQLMRQADFGQLLALRSRQAAAGREVLSGRKNLLKIHAPPAATLKNAKAQNTKG